MQKLATRTFKSALRNVRQAQKVSLQELGLRIESDASHIFKIERGQDITLSTMLKLAEALEVTVQFGQYVIAPDPVTKKRARRKTN
jgi:transcriptional regulator with XRE-family HTH domain